MEVYYWGKKGKNEVPSFLTNAKQYIWQFIT